ncbi:MAG: TetR/AcrR family transcriptional regulator [Sandaracinaceae bacterium]|nr:TetR/AcrR family transcriptional regulator [Sandaracinaceae bacterium]
MRKAEQSAQTKAALIEAGIEMFGERGYRATSLKTVAERASITHGVIPFHFGNKEGLLLAVVEACFERFYASVLAPLIDRDRDYGVGDLRAILDAQVRFSDEHPEVSRVFQVLMAEAIGPSPELRPHYRAFQDRTHALGCAWVREGIERGVLRADLDVDGTVHAILSFLTGVRTHHLLAGLDRRAAHASMLAILEAGVLAANQGTDR